MTSVKGTRSEPILVSDDKRALFEVSRWSGGYCISLVGSVEFRGGSISQFHDESVDAQSIEEVAAFICEQLQKLKPFVPYEQSRD